MSSVFTCGYYTFNCLDPSSICYGSTSDGGDKDGDDREVLVPADNSEPLLSNAEIGGVIALSVVGFCFCGVAIMAACGLLPSGRLSRKIRDAPGVAANGAAGGAPGAPSAPSAAVNRSSGRAQQRSSAPVAEEGPSLPATLGTVPSIPSSNSNVAPAVDIE